MNWKLSVLKVIPLLTLTTGLLIPTNIAEAASSAPKESATTHTDSHAGGHKKAATVSQILLSKKAQKVEFFGLLGIIGASLVVPELFKKSKKNNQSQNSSNQSNSQVTAKNQNEPDISYLEEILKDTKQIDLTSNNLVKLEDHKKNGVNNENIHNQKIS